MKRLLLILLIFCISCTPVVQQEPIPQQEPIRQIAPVQEPVPFNINEHIPQEAYTYDEEAPIQFFTKGNYATMVGTIDEDTPDTVDDLLNNNPQLTTIILLNVPGSDDDDSTFIAAEQVYNRGITTYLPEVGEVSSGGTDFIFAGKKRVIERGGRIGVHSWEYEDNETRANNIAEDSSEHDAYLVFFQKMGLTYQQARDFYFFTVNAAEPDDMHWMTDEEIDRYILFK